MAFINGIVIKVLNINKHKEWGGEVLFTYEGFVVRSKVIMPLKILIPIKKLMAQSVTSVTKDYIDTDKEV